MKVKVGDKFKVINNFKKFKKDDYLDVWGIDGEKINVFSDNGKPHSVHYFDFLKNSVLFIRPLEDTPSKPAHYDTGIDTIAFLRANCPPEQVEGFLRGNALKYLQRYDKKFQAVSDLKKCMSYLQLLIEEVESRDAEK